MRRRATLSVATQSEKAGLDHLFQFRSNFSVETSCNRPSRTVTSLRYHPRDWSGRSNASSTMLPSVLELCKGYGIWLVFLSAAQYKLGFSHSNLMKWVRWLDLGETNLRVTQDAEKDWGELKVYTRSATFDGSRSYHQKEHSDHYKAALITTGQTMLAGLQ